MSKKSDRYARQQAALRANTEKNRNKPKPAIKPNSTPVRLGSTNPTLADAAALAQGGTPIGNRRDGDTPSNSNFQGLRDQLNSDRLTGALGNINPTLINTLSGLAQSPMSPPPGKGMGQAATPEQEAAQRASIEESRKNMNITTGPDGKKFNTMRLGEAQPSPVAPVAQALQSPMSPPPGKAIGQILPTPTAPVPPAAASPIAPQPSAPAPQVVSPAASMQAQKDQMFPPAPAAPVAPAAPTPPKPIAPVAPAAAPIVPKPSQITPPAGVAKSQAEIVAEKLKEAPPKLVDLGKVKFGGSF